MNKGYPQWITFKVWKHDAVIKEACHRSGCVSLNRRYGLALAIMYYWVLLYIACRQGYR